MLFILFLLLRAVNSIKNIFFFSFGQFRCNFDLILTLIDVLQSILAEFYERFEGN